MECSRLREQVRAPLVLHSHAIVAMPSTDSLNQTDRTLEHIARLHSLSPACEVIRTTKPQPSQGKSLLMADHILGRYRTITVVDAQEVVAGSYRTDVTIMSRLIIGFMGC